MFGQIYWTITICPCEKMLCVLAMKSCGLYYKTITIVIMTIVSDATIWSITYGHN
jgi:hypothetical protein